MPSRQSSLQLRPRPTRRSHPGPRPAAPLLAGLVAGMLAGLLLAPTPAAAATPPAEPEITGPALGPERLPACPAVVADMAPRARLAQRLMVGVDASDPRGTAELVRATQVGGIFVGGNATDLLQNQAVRGVQAMARIPLAVAVDDEGGRVQRVDELDGKLPSARAMAAALTPRRSAGSAGTGPWPWPRGASR